MTGDIKLFAGTKVPENIRNNGLHPDMITVIASAADRPKELVLYGIELKDNGQNSALDISIIIEYIYINKKVNTITYLLRYIDSK